MTARSVSGSGSRKPGVASTASPNGMAEPISSSAVAKAPSS